MLQANFNVDPNEVGVKIGVSGQATEKGWKVVTPDTWYFRTKQMSDKIQTVEGYSDKNFYMDCTKAKIVCDVHKENPSASPGDLHAEILKRYLETQNLVIRPRELLVGNWANDEHGIPFDPRGDLWYPFKEFSAAGKAFVWENGEKKPVSKELYNEVQEFCERWNIVYAMKPYMSEKLYTMYFGGIQRYWEVPGTTGYRANPDHEWYMKKGFRNLINTMGQTIKRLEEEWETSSGTNAVDLAHRINDCKCSIKATEAVISWIKRHAQECKNLAASETNAKEKERLENLADICEWVSENPPRTFHEMMQMHWLSFMAHYLIEHASHTITFRPDQVWWEWYEKDVVKDKTLSREKAADIVAFYFIKYHEIGLLADLENFRKTGMGTRDYSVLTVGGQKADGSDATNALTMLILDVIDGYRFHFPDVKFRWHSRTSRKDLKRVIEVMRTGMGSPSLRNDNTAISGMMSQYGNMSLEEARSWAVVGCNTPGITINSRGATRRSARGMNVLKTIEFVMFNGRDPEPGWEIVFTKATGELSDLNTWDDFYKAWLGQYTWLARTGRNLGNIVDDFYNLVVKRPFLSMLYQRCVEEGCDLMSLDAPWLSFLNVPGWVDTMDSLTAVKYWVYDEKKYTLKQLKDAIIAEWEGYEDMRQDFLDAPKFGNNDDFADKIFAKAVKDVSVIGKTEVFDLRNEPAGFVSAVPVTWMYHLAGYNSAMPNGRKRGEALCDGGINPHAEHDKKGVWDRIGSSLKVDQSQFKSWVYNQKWDYNTVKGDAGLEKLLDFSIAGMEGGMDQLQYNLVSKDVLLDAKKVPEKYPLLAVRISGFSANFTALPEFVQDAVIERVQHEL